MIALHIMCGVYTCNSSRSSLNGVLNLHSNMCYSYGVLHVHSSICSSYGVLNLHSIRLHIMLYIFFSLYKYSNMVLILRLKKLVIMVYYF
ncbi:hypothetical protein Hanom_Chr11g01046371 [Helianthus anomalus]